LAGEAEQWMDTNAKKVRAMMRHVAQATFRLDEEGRGGSGGGIERGGE